MLRGSSGFYCYAIFEHTPEYPALNISVARLAFKLNAAMYRDTHLPVLLSLCLFSI
jgi:rhamnogalacturonan endolyase